MKKIKKQKKRIRAQHSQGSDKSAVQNISLTNEQAIQLAIQHFQAGNLQQAEHLIRQLLNVDPDDSEANHILGVIFAQQGRKPQLAIQHIKKAIQANSIKAEYHHNLGLVFDGLGRIEDAIASFRKALAINPDYAEAHNNLGAVLQESNRTDEAIASFRKALAINPDFADAHHNLGVAFDESGRIEDAIASYKNALDINPEHAEAYKSLSQVMKYTERDDVVQFMEGLYVKENIADKDKMYLGFALGKVFSDLKNYAKAFELILGANRLWRKSYEYSVQSEHDLFERVKKTFSPVFFSAFHGSGSQDKTPIFILGMPRSGTSLIEQILASHPQVYGAGEIRSFENVAKSTCARFTMRQFPECITDLDQNIFEQIGSEYIDEIREHSKDAKYITDKMPHNFILIGFIKAALPNAKVIHCVRNPMDNCLSIFKNVFRKGTHYYAYDLSELGRYYNLYLSLMEHWEKVLPGFMYTIRYEDMVEDQQIQTEKILDFCGLPWEESCLAFHKTARRVNTLSSGQVRRPIYKDSVELWKRYEKQLEPLRKAIYS